MSATGDLRIGRVEWAPLYRVRYSTDPSVQAVLKPVNDNAAAVVQLQELVNALLERVAALEASLAAGRTATGEDTG